MIFRSSNARERNVYAVYAVYALGAVGRKQPHKTVLCTVRRSEPASKQRHRVTTQWAFPLPTYEASEDLQLTCYTSRAVANCIALLPLFVGLHSLTGRLICPQHTFVLDLAVFCRSPHRVHIAFTRVARTENRVYLSAKWCLP